MRTHNEESQSGITPETALQYLKEGNERFVGNIKAHRNLLEQINETSSAQFPFATILSCIDSRTSAELIFDQGLGDIFSIRIAGNIVNSDILGSMEFGCGIAGSKLIVVLGHTNCGAVKGACQDLKFGHLTGLLEKIKPAIEGAGDSDKPDFMNLVTINNIKNVVSQIRERSKILSELEDEKKIMIIGGIYEVENGTVTFLE